ncbi:DUF916 and DUF3324 domain-containing protein [Schleiferilactobacillus perolens]|uniref:DUF916 and DUF3324 domain-containing protein n=1 Tax=Schleiferilactobacillus perolens TaxID=100468 RepID=UPI002352C16D|nr:DUF916 and DUF3324 domain-containing protein [Schleiferilactobacillus perolens]MCI2171510.1 DUF916 and DUF3324 domain-containing protein [Schleiferilactobacillus perolens]
MRRDLKRCGISYLLVLMLAFIAFGMFSEHVQAVDIKGAKFSIDLVFPKQQSDQSGTGFNVVLAPNETAQMGFVLHNKTNQNQTVVVRPTNATTTGTGDIDYQNWQHKPDASMNHPFTKLGVKTEQIKLPPKGTVRVVQTVKMPSALFDGVVLGGYDLSFAGDVLKEAKKAGKLPKTTGFLNAYAYAIGVMIISGHSERINPDFKLREVKPRLVNAQATLQYDLQNFQPMYIQNHGLRVTGTMTPRGSKKVINSDTLSMSFAPNSTAPILMRFGTQQVPAGRFTLHVVAKLADRTWQFSRNFTISNAEANRLNKNNASVKQSFLWLWILIGLFVLLVIVVLIVWLYRRALNRGRLEAEGKSRKNRR